MRLPLLLSALLLAAPASRAQDEVEGVFPEELGTTRNVHRSGALWFSGQFGQEDLGLLQEVGIRRVITLRTLGELEWDEQAAVEGAGLEFHALRFRGAETMTPELLDDLRQLLRESDGGTLLHCASANRVGAAWLPYRVLDQGVELEQALAEAREIGLRSPTHEEAALAYIARQRAGGRPPVAPADQGSFLDGQRVVRLRIDTQGKRLTLAFEDGNERVHELGFWPTAACSIGSDRLLVAGREPGSGATLLARVEGLVASTVKTVRLFQGRVEGLEDVHAMAPRGGVRGGALVVFGGGDVYELDGESGLLRRAVGPREVPALAAGNLNRLRGYGLEAGGYVYLLEPATGGAGVMLSDGDRDGSIDECGAYGTRPELPIESEL